MKTTAALPSRKATSSSPSPRKPLTTRARTAPASADAIEAIDAIEAVEAIEHQPDPDSQPDPDIPEAEALEQARRMVVKRALEYLDSLAQEAAGDTSVQRELAAAYERVGDVQGRVFDANLGQAGAARESRAKAL